PSRPAASPAASPAITQSASEVPAPSGSPADADTIRARWPDILAAVQSRRKVAWIQLSNASVESYADGVLTLAFAKAGTARGFQTGGYDTGTGHRVAGKFGSGPA